MQQIVCTSDQFFVQDYVRHLDNGNLAKGIMVYCPTQKEMIRVRARTLRYAQFRNHIVEVSKQDEKHLRVFFRGYLHLDK